LIFSERYSRMTRLLLPVGHAWRAFRGFLIRKLFDALSVLPEDIRHEAELVYFDLFPDTSRAIELWQEQFAVPVFEVTGVPIQSIIKSLWIGAGSGQAPFVLENALKQINPGLKLIENIPLKNPLDSNSVGRMVCGWKYAVCGNKYAVCGYRIGNVNFQPGVIINDYGALYDIPNDPRYWGTCFYIGGGARYDSHGRLLIINTIKINKKWEPYISYLLIKSKPAHSKIVVYIEYVDEEESV
jgi:hypothetical protein